MRDFWLRAVTHKSNPLYWPALFFFWIISWFYRIGLIIKNLSGQPKIKTVIPVISVGNLTVGGSGKTPVTIEIARHFMESGKNVGIVSSGYGRSVRLNYAGQGKDFTDKTDDASCLDNVGDEVMMMAEILPEAYFAVSESKSMAALRLDDDFPVDVIIVDDGYQHRKLHRDYNLLVLDASVDLRREFLFPLGRLREPLNEIDRADAVLITKGNLTEDATKYLDWIVSQFNDKSISEVEFINTEIISVRERKKIDEMQNKSIYFFAGIGNFDLLLKQMMKQFDNIIGTRQFVDHCRYNKSEARQLRNDINKLKPDYVITTHKDYVKAINLNLGQTLFYLDLKLNFLSGKNKLFDELDKAVEGM